MESDKTGKQIVSKGAYLKAQAKWARKCFQGASLLVIGGLCTVFAVLCLVGLLVTQARSLALLLLLFGPSGYLFLRLGFAAVYRIQSVEVVPLTRANVADLLAQDSLVRASEKPVQAQEAVLLRAATKGPETPPEQLVRAATKDREAA